MVGVVRDEKVNGIADDRSAGVYVSNEQSPVYFQTLNVRTERRSAGAAEGHRRGHSRRQQGSGPDRHPDRGSDQERDRWPTIGCSRCLLGVFGAVALLLAGIGIYGVISYSVAQRTQEIGIRAALGASERCCQLVLSRGVVLTVVGLVIGVAGSLGLTRLMAPCCTASAPAIR